MRSSTHVKSTCWMLRTKRAAPLTLDVMRKIIIMKLLFLMSCITLWSTSAYAKNNYTINCQEARFDVSASEINKSIGTKNNNPLKFIAENDCNIRDIKGEHYLTQIYNSLDLLMFRADINDVGSKLIVQVKNIPNKIDIKEIHLKYVLNGLPYALASFRGEAETGYRFSTWHFTHGKNEFHCPPKGDYLVIIEWKDNVEKINLAFKYRIQNITMSCHEKGFY